MTRRLVKYFVFSVLMNEIFCFFFFFYISSTFVKSDLVKCWESKPKVLGVFLSIKVFQMKGEGVEICLKFSRIRTSRIYSQRGLTLQICLQDYSPRPLSCWITWTYVYKFSFLRHNLSIMVRIAATASRFLEGYISCHLLSYYMVLNSI